MQNKIIIADTHFGCRQNSPTWFKYQKKFIYNQLIPDIRKIEGPKVLIHLGDLFDSRSTISTLISEEVISILKDLKNEVDRFIVVCGNHDYYSPTSDENCYIRIFEDLIGIEIISRDVMIEGEDMYVPWYKWFDQIELQRLIDTNGIKNVFTHADIISSEPEISCDNIFSGHVHIPYIKGCIKNLGSVYPLKFSDANAPRGYYIYNDKGLMFVENTSSIKFYRIYDDNIFNLPDIKPYDYIELYISAANSAKPEFIKQIDYISKTYKNTWVIPSDFQISESTAAVDYNIEKMISDMIPDDLRDKFSKIIDISNEL